MKYLKSFFIISLVFSLVACRNGDKTVVNELEKPETIAVTTYQLQQSEAKVTINSTGMLTTENEAMYAFIIGGVIDRIYVNEGGYFKKGELLASLIITEIEAGYLQARLGLEKAERDLQRVTNLYQDSISTLEQLQNTRTAFEIAKRQVEALAFNKEYAYIYAANDGFVTKKLANEGEVIAGGNPVLAINENSGENVWILKVGLSDRDWAMVESGNPAEIFLDAFPEKIFNGSIFRKSLAAETGTGTFQVDVQVNLQGVSPAIGMFGKAVISTNVTQKFQSIPYGALIEADGRNAFVFVPLPGGRIKRQPIEIASFDNSWVHVKSGLEDVTEIVISNSAFLNENSIITIIQ